MKLLLAAGGTGGHVIPALTIANAARLLEEKAPILFVGTAKGFENDLVPGTGYGLELIRLRGLKGKGIAEKIANAALLPGAFLQSWRILRRFSPTAVFGIGGYASGPILLLAALSNHRTAILEPNAIPGFANRVLARFVDRVFVAFDEARARLPETKCVVSGNPIRAEILAVPPPTFEGKKRGILIFGGSQGARRINQAVIDMLPDFAPEREQVFFIHQTGQADYDRVLRAYREHGIPSDVQPFIRDMAGAYRASDVVIARSGSSVLEIAACGRPAILVPFPHAADDHQRANARVIERAGAALVIEDGALDGKTLSMELRELLRDPGRLKRMSGAALSLRRADAARVIAADLATGKARNA
ncbi:MAG: undecaprenyldiphospho-muramoylpentapeptide beta-N-acetylglucosaminyltransferase [Pseudomonadota bacterium]